MLRTQEYMRQNYSAPCHHFSGCSTPK